jgi:hypothetical protein
MRLLIVGIVSLGGAVLGWDTAATHSTTKHAAAIHLNEVPTANRPESSTLVVVRVPAAVSNEEERAQEVARLEVRNRRLEALVRVLKTREAER